MRLVRLAVRGGGGVGEGLLGRIADAVGTPAYVYRAETIRDQYQRLDRALAPVPHRICYSVKANGNLAVLALLKGLGAGADIVSGGELARALRAGFAGPDIVFSGVGKTQIEMRAALEAGVGMISVESEEELAALTEVTRAAGRAANVGIRVNPEVTVETHPYTQTGVRGKKFGVPADEAGALAQRAASTPGLELRGIAMHLGSQITDEAPYVAAVLKLLEIVADLRRSGIGTLELLDLGGGLGIGYRDGDRPLDVDAYARAVLPHVATSRLKLIVEPGRFLVGAAGVLLTRVLYRKRSGGHDIAIIDAGMTDLIRPSHYQAYHEIRLVGQDTGRPHVRYDVVGPICESGDFFALDRELPRLDRGDLLEVRGAGAYGFVMTSTYNARSRPPEVLVDGDRFAVVRARESEDDLMRGETTSPRWRNGGGTR
jgi:diaminopimelate decarboxylase